MSLMSDELERRLDSSLGSSDDYAANLNQTFAQPAPYKGLLGNLADKISNELSYVGGGIKNNLEYLGNGAANMFFGPLYNNEDFSASNLDPRPSLDYAISHNQNMYGDPNTYLGSFENNLINGSAGVVGGIADLLHLDTIGDTMNKIGTATTDSQQVDPGWNWE